MSASFSLIVSQIGYGPDGPKPFFVRAAVEVDETPTVSLVLSGGGDANVPLVVGDPTLIWGMQIWRGEFDAVTTPGTYWLELSDGTRSDPFVVGHRILLEQTLVACSVDNLEARIGGKLGWQDCAFDGRGLESHAIVVSALIDVVLLVSALDDDVDARLREQIRHGADYLISCQRADGSFMSEYYIGRDLTVWTLCGLACIALSRAAELLSSGTYLEASKTAWTWILGAADHGGASTAVELESTRRVFGQYSPWTPPAVPRARDQLLLLRAATELYRNTNDLSYGAEARRIARSIRDEYQVRRPGSLGLFGNFRAWPAEPVYEPAWEHAGWGYNCGAVLPDDVSGFIALLELFPDSEDADLWREVLWDYASGYLIPATSRSPFGIYPLGMYGDDVRFFSPAWHGFNGMYGQIARQCMQLAVLFGEPQLERLAHANLQWIAGLNIGTDVAPGRYQGLSWICGIGENSAEAWSGIRGSVGNGFSATPQFRLEHLDDIEDAPRHLTNEDWLVHTGSWLSGLAHVSAVATVKVRTTQDGVGVPAQVTVRVGEVERTLTAGIRGVAIVGDLPAMTDGTVTVTWDGHRVERAVRPVSGARTVVSIDFAVPVVMSGQTAVGSVGLRNDGDDRLDLKVAVSSAAGRELSNVTLEPRSEVNVPVSAANGEWFRMVASTSTAELVFEPALATSHTSAVGE